MSLYELYVNLYKIRNTLSEAARNFEKVKSDYVSKMNEIKQFIKSEERHGLDSNRLKEGLKFIEFSGEPWVILDGQSPIQEAQEDISLGIKKLRTEYFGSKRYSGFYQRSNHPYGFGPKHGSIVDRIGLSYRYRTHDFTKEELSDILYVLANLENYIKCKPKENGCEVEVYYDDEKQ